MTHTEGDYEALGFAGVLAKPVPLSALKAMLEVAGAQGRRAFFAQGVAKG